MTLGWGWWIALGTLVGCTGVTADEAPARGGGDDGSDDLGDDLGGDDLGGDGGGTLHGHWQGSVVCPSGGESGFALYLRDEDDGSYVGDGLFAFTRDGTPLQIWFTAQVEHDAGDGDGEVELDLEADDCEEVYVGAFPCERFEGVVWTPGEGRIDGNIPDFLGLGVDCSFTLER